MIQYVRSSKCIEKFRVYTLKPQCMSIFLGGKVRYIWLFPAIVLHLLKMTPPYRKNTFSPLRLRWGFSAQLAAGPAENGCGGPAVDRLHRSEIAIGGSIGRFQVFPTKGCLGGGNSNIYLYKIYKITPKNGGDDPI